MREASGGTRLGLDETRGTRGPAMVARGEALARTPGHPSRAAAKDAAMRAGVRADTTRIRAIDSRSRAT